MKSQKKKKELLFEELLWIPEYLSKVYNLQKIGYEQDDIKNDLRIILWKSINAYLKLLRNGNKPKCSIRAYAHKSCINAKGNIIRKLYAEKNNKTVGMEIYADIGIEKNIDININIKGDVKIFGQSLFQFLDIDKNKIIIFKKYLIGFSYEELSIMFDLSLQQIKNILFQVRKEIRKKFATLKNNSGSKMLFINKKGNIDD